MTSLRHAALALAFLLAACAAPPAAPGDDAILAVGDSVLAWNRRGGGDIPTVAGRALGRPVANRAVPGARLSHPNPLAAGVGFEIPRQSRAGAWDWVVLDGGGNDLLAEGGCGSDPTVLDAVVAPSGRGELPDLARRIAAAGPRVMIVGYYQPSVRGGPFAPCADEIAEMNRRLAAVAAATDRVHFVDTAAVMPPTRLDLYDPDLVHPSPAGSRAIGRHVAAAIAAAEAPLARGGASR